ncbi:putative reverse transcriptase domain-containing protein [Tanacetum coccineum]
MPIELGSFEVVIGTGWLTKYHDMIIVIKRLFVSPLGDETLTIRSNKSDGYTSIIASEQKAELFNRTGTLERDNMRLRCMLGFERQRVDRLWHSHAVGLTNAPEVFIDLINRGIHFDTAMIESIKDKEMPTTPMKIRKFLGSENFVVYCDASYKGLGAVLMQKEKVIAYASRQLKVHKKNYTDNLINTY